MLESLFPVPVIRKLPHQTALLSEPLMKNRLSLARLGRAGRSYLTLNRDREYGALKRMLEVKPTDVVLDVGCGDGFWTSRIAPSCQHIVGVDPDRKVLEHGRVFHGLSNVTYMCATAESLPFEDAAFDKVLSVSCLEHFADPWRGLAEMARVVKTRRTDRPVG